MKKIILLPLTVFLFVIAANAQPAASEDVSIPAKGAELKGTLLLPAHVKKPPVVLIIAGSGPTDRDGNSPIIAGKNNSLLQLADSLAQHGIASLRFDKRGIAKSMVKNFVEDSMHFSDYVHDAETIVAWLQAKGFKKIFIAGHSEGSLVGLATAAAVPVAGYISIAGAGRNIADVLREQVSSLPDTLRQLAWSYLDSLHAGKRIARPTPMLLNIFRPSVQPYLISWMQYEPASLIARLRCPVLVIQGTKDIQVVEKDARLLATANSAAQLLLVKNMNHVLKEVISDSRADNIKAYSNPDLPLLPEMTAAIVNFITTKQKRR